VRYFQGVLEFNRETEEPVRQAVIDEAIVEARG
jgi:hypothetical protein